MLRSSPWWIRTSPISTVETVGAWSTRTPRSPSAILRLVFLAGDLFFRALLRFGLLARLVLPFGPFLFSLFFLLGAHPAGLLNSLVDVTDEVEGLLRQLVVLTFDDLLERPDRVFEFDELALHAGELLGDEERLREEALEPPRPAYDDLVLLGELVYPEDGDDVLELLVALEDVLYLLGDLVMLLADDRGVEYRRG